MYKAIGVHSIVAFRDKNAISLVDYNTAEILLLPLDAAPGRGQPGLGFATLHK